jgi:hypothetical protein
VIFHLDVNHRFFIIEQWGYIKYQTLFHAELAWISSKLPSSMIVACKNYGHFTHEPRAVTMKLWESKRKCPKFVPTHFQNHEVWSQILKCSVKSYATGPSTKCYFKELMFMRILTHDKNRKNKRLWTFRVPWSPTFVLSLPVKNWVFKIVQVTMKHDPFDAM